MMTEFFCCGLHHSSYCPEVRGVPCGTRIAFRLDPNGVNEEKIREILGMEKTTVKRLAKQTDKFPKNALLGNETGLLIIDESDGEIYDSTRQQERRKNDV